MDSSLRERFAQLGPIRAVQRVSSGSPAVFVLRLPTAKRPDTIDATLALARRGMTMLRAKRTIESLLTERRVVIEVPMVEDPDALAADLAAAGIAAAVDHH